MATMILGSDGLRKIAMAVNWYCIYSHYMPHIPALILPPVPPLIVPRSGIFA